MSLEELGGHDMDGGVFNPKEVLDAASVIHPDKLVDAEIRVTLAESVSEMSMCWAIRATVFLTLPGRRFTEQYDANEFSCGHLLVYVGGEPAGTMRLRWFADFVRFERLAIREEFRSLKVFRALVDFAMRLCAAKGYRAVIGVSRAKGLPFWRRLGAKLGDHPISYLGETVYPMTFDPREIGGGTHPELQGGAGRIGETVFERRLAAAESSLVAM